MEQNVLVLVISLPPLEKEGTPLADLDCGPGRMGQFEWMVIN